MNILLRKLIFNEAEIHLIQWNGKPCFFVSELTKALDCVNKDDIPIFLRKGGSTVKGIDYDVAAGAEAKDLRSCLENCGIKKRFSRTTIIYFQGLRKYFNYRKTVETRDFINYLEKCKISLDDETVASVGTIAHEAAISTPAPPPPAPSDSKASAAKKRSAAKSSDSKSASSSDFLKHISFIEEFVDAFNRLHIPADKSLAFTKSMAKFFEDNGIQAGDFLKEIKKWIG